MKALTCTQPGILTYIEKDTPFLQSGQSLLRVKRIGICGTDLHAFEGTQPFFSYPRILGHEISGELIDPNGAEGFEKDEAVTIIPYFNCGECIACRLGKPNCCTVIQVCGVHIDGGLSEFLAVPSTSLVKSEGLNYEQLALVEPLAIGAHGVRRANVSTGEFVLVIGAGPIGLATMAFAKIAGAQVIAMDINENRLDFCRTQLRVDHVVNAVEDDVLTRLGKITNNDMPTIVIDCTGNLAAINHGFSYMAHGGKYILVGLQKGEIKVSHPEFHKREATLMSSRNATRADFDHVIYSIKNGLIDPLHFITHRVMFDEVKNEFESWLNPASGVIKAMVTFS